MDIRGMPNIRPIIARGGVFLLPWPRSLLPLAVALALLEKVNARAVDDCKKPAITALVTASPENPFPGLGIRINRAYIFLNIYTHVRCCKH